MAEPELLYDKRESYAIITLNRPERLNANTNNMTDLLWASMGDFNADAKMRAGVLTGAGRGFSTGHDMKEMNEKIADLELDKMTTAERIALGERGTAGRIGQGNMPFGLSPKPWIAAINGPAVGSGFGRALDCDIRICSDRAWVGTFEAKRGRVSISAIDFPRMGISASAANYMLMTTDRIYPDQMLRWGIVSEVVEHDQLLPRAMEIAEMCAQNAPLSLQATKALMRDWRDTKRQEADRFYEWAGYTFRYSDDAMEGPRALAEGRQPNWQGR